MKETDKSTSPCILTRNSDQQGTLHQPWPTPEWSGQGEACKPDCLSHTLNPATKRGPPNSSRPSSKTK